ncbi:MAG: ADOP family duplicated permease [Longimicrobiales bacterium]
MSLWSQLTRGLRVLRNRDGADQDIADEVEHFFEQAAAERRARGLSPEEAKRAARLELGSVTGVREQVRTYGWENGVDGVLGDARYALRRLRGAPGFSAIAVLTLALGIGAMTAIFSVVKPILLEPLPYPGADGIAMIWDGWGGSRLDVTFGTYRELAQRARSFGAFSVFKPWQPTLGGGGVEEPERLDGQRVSARYLEVLGVEPALGRDFEDTDDRLNGPRVVILSDGLWRRRFGDDGAIVGRQVTLDGDSYTVIGVLPDEFENVLAPATEVWAPLQYDMSEDRAWGHHLRMVGRLRRGVGPDRGERELDEIARAPVAELPRASWATIEHGLIVNPLKNEVTAGVKPALFAISGAVALLLVIACVNVTNLLLAQSARRRAEFAVRAALGAGRTRLVRQLLMERLILTAVGGVAAMAVAVFGVRVLVALSPPDLPRVGAIGIDAAVFAFALGITTLVGLACGLIPALAAGRNDPQRALQQDSHRFTSGHRRTRSALVVAEVALAFVLLVGSGLLLRSLERLFAVDPGVDASDLLTLQVHATGGRFTDPSVTQRFFAESLEAVREVPGVAGAALTSSLPLSDDFEGFGAAAASYGIHFDLSRELMREGDRSGFRYSVSPGYFEAMRIPLLRGRLLGEGDRADAPLVVVISESLARRRLPGVDPLGQRLRIGAGPLFTVVGVVGDVRHVSLALDESDAVYTTADQWFVREREVSQAIGVRPSAENVMSFVIRARTDAASLAPAVREAVWSVDRDRPVVRLATMDELLIVSTAERRFALILFEAFALAAMLLATIGIYGVLAGSVTERTREIGVRSALGASRVRILGAVLGQGMTLAGLGIAFGAAGAVAASQAITSMLFGVSRLDAITYSGVIAVLGAVSAIACAVPAWRAARVDPARTLRET